MSWSDRARRIRSSTKREFGEPITYEPQGGEPLEITGIYSEPHELVEVGESSVSSTAPTLGIELGDLPAKPRRDDRLVRQSTGTAYRVAEVIEDGEGGASLRLYLE